MSIALTNGRIITENGILDNTALLVDNSIILGCVAIADLPDYPSPIQEDVHGQFIVPGFIDIHSDMIEQIIQPRPSSIMDFEMALKEGEKQLINQGITTMFHSLSLYKDDHFGVKEIRKSKHVTRLARLIASIHERDHLIHHRFHARYEIDNTDCLEYVRQLITEGLVHEFSIMDHTPGQGQYRDPAVYRKHISGYKGQPLSEDEWQRILQDHQEKQRPQLADLRDLIQLALDNQIAVSSHDDDTVAKVDLVNSLGVSISEFPITLEVARRAKELGMQTVAGAPNVLLGGSHAGNLSATEAILEGCIDILCSDYYPAALLHAVFILHQQYGLPLHRAVNLVTINPARAMKIDQHYGSIAMGKKADLLVIELLDGYPAITRVMIHGQWASRLAYRI